MALAFCSLLWGATFVVVRGALDHISVFLFLAVRFSLATLLMALFRPAGLRNLKKGELFAGAALGLFMFGGYAFQTAGLQYTTPAKSGFVTGSSVVLVPLLLGIFWKRRLTAWIYFGTLAAVGGLYLLTVPAEGSGAAESRRFADAGRRRFVRGAHYSGEGIHAEAFGGGVERVAGGRVRGAGLGGDGGGFGDRVASGEVCVAMGAGERPL